MVSTDDSSPVQFGVERSSGVLYTGTATASSPVIVNLPTTLITNNNGYNYRSNGVHVYTTGQGSISVLANNFRSGKVAEYLAYPFQELSGAPYEYYIVSTHTSGRRSQFLLVGCEDNTTITITPTQTVIIPKDVQIRYPSCLQTTKASSAPQKSSHTVFQACPEHTSTRPSLSVSPSANLTAPTRHKPKCVL